LLNSFQTLALVICQKRQGAGSQPAMTEVATGIQNKIREKVQKKATPAKMPQEPSGM
jgi:hypothetical protein